MGKKKYTTEYYNIGNIKRICEPIYFSVSTRGYGKNFMLNLYEYKERKNGKEKIYYRVL